MKPFFSVCKFAGLLLLSLSFWPAKADEPWDISIVVDGYRPGQYISLEVFPLDHPFLPGQSAISYYDYIDYDLEFAWFGGAQWRRTTVDADGDVGKYSRLAILPTGSAAIVYFDDTNNVLL